MTTTKESSTSEKVIAACPDTVGSDILKTDTERVCPEWHVIKVYFVNQAATFIPKGPYLTARHTPSSSFRNNHCEIWTRNPDRSGLPVCLITCHSGLYLNDIKLNVEMRHLTPISPLSTVP